MHNITHLDLTPHLVDTLKLSSGSNSRGSQCTFVCFGEYRPNRSALRMHGRHCKVILFKSIGRSPVGLLRRGGNYLAVTNRLSCEGNGTNGIKQI